MNYILFPWRMLCLTIGGFGLVLLFLMLFLARGPAVAKRGWIAVNYALEAVL